METFLCAVWLFSDLNTRCWPLAPVSSMSESSRKTFSLSRIERALTPVISCSLLIVQLWTVEEETCVLTNKENAIAFLILGLQYIWCNILLLISVMMLKSKGSKWRSIFTAAPYLVELALPRKSNVCKPHRHRPSYQACACKKHELLHQFLINTSQK